MNNLLEIPQTKILSADTYALCVTWQESEKRTSKARKEAIMELIDEGAVPEHTYSPYGINQLDDQQEHIAWHHDFRLIAQITMTDRERKMLEYSDAEYRELKGPLHDECADARKTLTTNLYNIRTSMKKYLQANEVNSAGSNKRPTPIIFAEKLQWLTSNYEDCYTEDDAETVKEHIEAIEAIEMVDDLLDDE